MSFNENIGSALLAIVFIAGGFFAGTLWTENKMLKTGANPTQKQVGQPNGNTNPTGEKADTLDKMPELSAKDHIRGAKNPKIYLVEYSDYECPFCEKFHPTTKQILEDYDQEVAIVFRHYPLSFHPNAQAAAETAECIASQNGNEAFWKYTDEMFVQNKKLGGKISPDAIDIGIKASGADATAVKKCVESGEMTEVVSAQQSGGAAAGVSGTPGTILLTKDGKRELISGALPFAQVKQVIDKYL